MFSRGDTDVEQMDVIEHTIPLLKATPRWLGLTKGREVDCQVADLVQRGMVEPADGAWGLELAGRASPQKVLLLAAMHRLLSTQCSHQEGCLPPS